MRTENLAIVFIDIAGFTPRTSAQTREENLRMLRRFDDVVRPVVRAYSGRVVKTIGDAYLLTFRSPTNALLCSMAIHDRIAETDSAVDSADRFTVRAAANVGEVRLEEGDVFGEAVNIAARIETKVRPGEIYFSESVFLSMTRSEVPSEEIGPTELKGIAEKVRLYRIPHADEAGGYSLGRRSRAPEAKAGNERHPLAPETLPFAGLGLDRIRGEISVSSQPLAPVMAHARGFFTQARDALLRGIAWWRIEVRRSRAVQVATVIVLIGLVIIAAWALKPRHTATPLERLQRSLGL